MARDPLDEDGRLNGVDVIVDGMENARGRNEMRASHKDLLSVQQSMVYIRLERESSSDNCSCTPVFCSSTSGSIGVNNVVSLI